eukprot:gene9061-11099_t
MNQFSEEEINNFSLTDNNENDNNKIVVAEEEDDIFSNLNKKNNNNNRNNDFSSFLDSPMLLNNTTTTNTTNTSTTSSIVGESSSSNTNTPIFVPQHHDDYSNLEYQQHQHQHQHQHQQQIENQNDTLLILDDEQLEDEEEQIVEEEEVEDTIIIVDSIEVSSRQYQYRVDKWRNDFNSLVPSSVDQLQDVDDGKVINSFLGCYGLPDDSTIRGLFWKLSLGCLPTNSKDDWLNITSRQRKKYETLKKSYIIDPRSTNAVDDPLSQSENSIWNMYFENENIQKEIGHDISRTYPGIDFFERKDIQDLMTRILFIFSKQYPKVKYLQGMNEILAPVVFSVYSDSHWFNDSDVHKPYGNIYYPSKPITYPKEDTVEYTLRDPDYFEHDSYFIFESIMNKIGKWFTSPPSSPLPPPKVYGKRKEVYDLLEKEASEQAVNIIVVNECVKMFNNLQVIDPQLHTYLKDLSIEPHLYSLRWIRIMLAQVFPMNSILVLWDAIFRDSFDLLNYVCISMLIAIKDNIIGKDYSECLQQLFHYPSQQDILTLLKNAYSIEVKLKKNEGVVLSSPKPPPPVLKPSTGKYPKSFTDSVIRADPKQVINVQDSVSTVKSQTHQPQQHQPPQKPQQRPSQPQPQPQRQQPQPQQSQQSQHYQPKQHQPQPQQHHQNNQQQNVDIISSITSTFKQMINNLNEMDPSKQLEKVVENQIHVASRLERLIYILETIKTDNNSETIQSVQDEIISIRKVLNNHPNHTTTPNTPSPVLSSHYHTQVSNFSLSKEYTSKSNSLSNNTNNNNNITTSPPQQITTSTTPPNSSPASLSPQTTPPPTRATLNTSQIQQLKNLSTPSSIPISEDDLVEVVTEHTTLDEDEDDDYQQKINFMNRFSRCNTIKKIIAKGIPITDKSIEYSANYIRTKHHLSGFLSLHTLIVNDTFLTDQSLEYFKEFPSISCIELLGTHCTKLGLEQLQSIFISSSNQCKINQQLKKIEIQRGKEFKQQYEEPDLVFSNNKLWPIEQIKQFILSINTTIDSNTTTNNNNNNISIDTSFDDLNSSLDNSIENSSISSFNLSLNNNSFDFYNSPVKQQQQQQQSIDNLSSTSSLYIPNLESIDKKTTTIEGFEIKLFKDPFSKSPSRKSLGMVHHSPSHLNIFTFKSNNNSNKHNITKSPINFNNNIYSPKKLDSPPAIHKLTPLISPKKFNIISPIHGYNNESNFLNEDDLEDDNHEYKYNLQKPCPPPPQNNNGYNFTPIKNSSKKRKSLNTTNPIKKKLFVDNEF